MGRGDVDAVEQDGDLVEGAASHADVGLYAVRPALPDIYGSTEFDNVVDSACARRRDVVAGEARDESCRHLCRQWGVLSDDGGFAECDGVVCQSRAVRRGGCCRTAHLASLLRGGSLGSSSNGERGH